MRSSTQLLIQNVPALQAMPDVILEHMFRYLDGGNDEHFPAFISLQRTCKTLNKTTRGLKKGNKNLVVECLGTDALRYLISRLLEEKMYDPISGTIFVETA